MANMDNVEGNQSKDVTTLKSQSNDTEGGIRVLDHSSVGACGQSCSASNSSPGDHREAEKATDTTNQEQPAIAASEDFSVFTVTQKRAIVLTGSFAAWFSPMTGSIYYPALNQARQQ